VTFERGDHLESGERAGSSTREERLSSISPRV